MKLIFIRHGDPDYEHDSLTDTGAREAELLVPRVEKLEAKEFYVSPLGRAQATAAPSLKKLGKEAVTLEWLREFDTKIERPDKEKSKSGMAWDWLPADWMDNKDFYDRDRWLDHPVFTEKNLREKYDHVVKSFDEFLADHGYERTGQYFNVTHPNNDTIVFFTHFGCETLLLSYLMNISPMVLWHGLCALPSSVTTVVSEERRKGIAHFRCIGYGDVSHLYAGGAEPSFSARFCECYDNENERHD
ncbi:MAG: phosphoglycerate mutase family protein [Lachnospiraceae bacterium]|nr:phosphoglycerate mutase family protein [Lachnospiraceae bacterium]